VATKRPALCDNWYVIVPPRANGADPVSRIEPTRSARGLRREPSGLPGAQVASDPQDRWQRRARAGAFGPHWFFKPVHVMSLRVRQSLVDQRAQGVGRPASDLRKPDPWSCGGVWGPTTPRVHCRLHRHAGGHQPNKASSRDARLPDLRAIVAATTLQSRAISSLLASSARLSAIE
jgi:hypothetical protein